MKQVLVLAVSLLAFVAFNASARELPEFTDLVEQNVPAVVNISTVGETRSQSSQPQRKNPRNSEELEEFFKYFRPPQPRGRPRSLGSGFIISKDGYILTNNHVVDGAKEIVVRFSDRRELVATLVGQDSRADLAVLKVETDEPLPTVEIGRSETLKVGSWVLAIGSPFGFDYSVTAGIVSAKGRSLPTDQNENYVPYIQTDVAINPGNSGGPLFNLEGKVVGINAQIYSNSGGFMGVSFAIPIDVAMEVADQLRSEGRVSRGWLGVMIQEVNRDLAESFGLERPHGALISKVFNDTPAATGGLREGDIITTFNGRSIERSSELPQLVGRVRAGAVAELQLMRDGEKMELELKVGELADLAQDGQSAKQPTNNGRLGLVVAPLVDDDLARLDLEGGVRVVEVDEQAQESGIRRGDIITRLNHRPILDEGDFDEISGSLEAGRTVPILVLRNQNPVFLALRIPED
ncbi:MAG: serine protease Do [Candidatus Azotimanducaceae bacterium]|jgi:serine protease Do